MDITYLRAQNPNNIKILAELGYISNSVFGILETIGRGLAWGVVSNPLSNVIAGCITADSPEKREEYEKLAKLLKESAGITLEATFQSGASILTNPLSHECNIRTADAIRGTIIDDYEVSPYRHPL